MPNDFTSNLNKRKPDPGDFNWDNEWHENEDIDDFVLNSLLSNNRVSSGFEVTDGGGLNAVIADGYVPVSGESYKITGTTKLLTGGLASEDTGRANWIYIDSSGIIQASTTPPSGDYLPLALVDCDDTSILRIADLRPMELERMIENNCINGTFDVWQRSVYEAVPASSNVMKYLADRMCTYIGNNPNVVYLAQQTFDTDQTTVPGNPRFYHRTNVSGSPTTGTVRLDHKVLDVRRYAGKRVRLVFWAKCDAARTVELFSRQNSNGGSFDIITHVEAINLTTSWQEFSIIVDFPSIADTETINDPSYSGFMFYLCGQYGGVGTYQGGIFDFAEMEIYISDKELPVRRPSFDETLRACLPFCVSSLFTDSVQAVHTVGYGHSTGEIRTAGVSFPAEMIRSPSVTVYQYGTGLAGVADYNKGSGWISCNGIALTQNNVHFTAKLTSSGIATLSSYGARFDFLAEAEL